MIGSRGETKSGRWLLTVVALGSMGIGLRAAAVAEQVRVLQPEGVVHGFLALRNLEGDTLADGDLIQVMRASGVESRLVFTFRDGSIHDETAVFSQKRTFRLGSYHLVQKGPSFPLALDATIDCASGKVRVEHRKGGEAPVVLEEKFDLPADLANGLLMTLLKNAAGRPSEVSLVAFAPKPRLVKLKISPQGDEPFAIGASSRRAMRHVVKVELGGVAGVVAPLVGKQPPDSLVWILGGVAPAFLRSEQPLYAEGPIWRIDLTNPKWPA